MAGVVLSVQVPRGSRSGVLILALLIFSSASALLCGRDGKAPGLGGSCHHDRGVALILAVVLPVSQLLMKLGPDHAGLAAVIRWYSSRGSVALLTVYLSARRKRQKAATTPVDRHQEGTVAVKQKTKGH